MKVNIGPYPKWWGPYQIVELIPFISEETQHKIIDWLVFNTFITKLCNWWYDKNPRKVKIRIDRYDTWNMDHTLALIILPMLKQLKETKHGSPIVDDEDVPVHMRYSDPKVFEDGWDGGDNWIHYKWEWILNEMIWAFEHIVDDEWESSHYGNNDYREIDNRVRNGLKLFGKYYRNLWD